MRHEFRKTARYILPFIALMIVLTFVFSFFMEARPEEDKGLIRSLFEEYTKDPAAFDEKYKNFSYVDEHNGGQIDGYAAWKIVHDARLYAARYAEDLDIVIFHAKVESSELFEGTYLYDYQQKVIQKYENLRDRISVGVECTYGWEEYFSWTGEFGFLTAALLFVSVMIFTADLRSMPLLRAAARRNCAIFHKTALLFVYDFLLTVLLWAAAFLPFLIKFGLQGGTCPIQSLPLFEYCPFEVSIFEFVLLRLLVRFFGACFLSFLFALVSILLENRIFSFSLCVGVCLLCTACRKLFFVSKGSLPACFNPFTALESNDAFSRFFCVFRVPGAPSGFLSLLFLQMFLLILFVLLIHWLFYRHLPHFSFPFLKRSSQQKKAPVFRSQSIFIYECGKIAARRKLLVLLLAFFICKLGSTIFIYDQSYEDDFAYKDCLSKFGGEITEETPMNLILEQLRVKEVLSNEDEMAKKYKNGEINDDEYRAYMSLHWRAYFLQPALVELEEYYNRISDREGAHLIYDKAYTRFLEGFPDPLLLLSAFTAVFVVAAQDRENGMEGIFCSTLNGRRRTAKIKATLCFLLTLALSVLYAFTELAILVHFYGVESPFLPMSSLRSAPALLQGLDIAPGMLVLVGVRVGFCCICTLAVFVLVLFCMNCKKPDNAFGK